MVEMTHTHALPGPDDVLLAHLPNGLTVLARSNFASPAVVVEGLLRGGALLEPDAKTGLANFHSALLTRGTEHYTFDELFEQIEGNGADFDVSSGGHSLRFGSKSLAEDLPLMLTLGADVLRRPIFPEMYVERVRGQLLTGLQLRAHNTRAMAALKFNELAYPAEHPYSKSLDGMTETVSTITRDDLVAYQQLIGPQDGIVVIVGAVEPDDAVRLVAEAFGDWENPAQPPPPVAPPAPRLETIRSEMVEIPGKSQADIVLGYPGPARDAEDYQAARMANSILGMFGMYGRLGDSVRQAQGLAYYSYSRLTGGLGPGPWRVIAGVAPEKVPQAVKSIREEIRRIVEEPVSEDELADNKAFFTGQLVLGLETNEGVAGSLLSMVLYDLGLDYLHRYQSIIESLTVEQLQAAASHYLDPNAYALAVAGPPGTEIG